MGIATSMQLSEKWQSIPIVEYHLVDDKIVWIGIQDLMIGAISSDLMFKVVRFINKGTLERWGFYPPFLKAVGGNYG
jgi:hypothetical protein